MKRARFTVLLIATASFGCSSQYAVDTLQSSDQLGQRQGQNSGDPSATEATTDEPGNAATTKLRALPTTLSIEDAVLLALEGNRNLAVQRLSTRVAGAFEQIESGAFDPLLYGSVQYGTEKSSEVARSTGDRFDVDAQDSQAEIGILQRTALGLLIDASVTQRFTASNRTPDQQATRLGLTLTQSLLRGFGPGANLAAVRIANLETAISIYQLRAFVEALVAETEIAYWRHHLALRRMEIVERSLAVAQKQREELDARISVGTAPELDAHAAAAEVALREQAVIDARAEREATRLRLLQLINTRQGFEADAFSLSSTHPQSKPVTDVAPRTELALQSRPDLKEAVLRHEQRRLETVATSNGLLPRLDFFVSLGKTGFADTFSRSLSNLDQNTYDITVGASFDYNLGGGPALGRANAAEASYAQAQLAIDNLRQQIALDVRLALNELERARQQVAASAATREQQEKTVFAETERFAVGRGTALRVALAQRDLLASEVSEVQARVDYAIARVQLHLAEGSVLSRRGLKLDEQVQAELP